MTEKIYGGFAVRVSSPYPVWISLEQSGGGALILTHLELNDLLFAVVSAIDEASRSLPPERRHELRVHRLGTS